MLDIQASCTYLDRYPTPNLGGYMRGSAEPVAITNAIIAVSIGASVVAVAHGPEALLLGFAAVLIGLGWWLLILARSTLRHALGDDGPRSACWPI